MINLKEYQQKDIQYFIISNVMLIMIFSTSNFNYYSAYKNIISVLSLLGMASVMYVYIVLIDNIITTSIKDRILFFNKKKLPGNNAFNRLFLSNAYNEYRVNRNDLKNFYMDIWDKVLSNNENDLYQNNEWYLIFKKVEDKSIIIQSNKTFLLTRDISIVSFLFVCIYPFINFVPRFYFNPFMELFFFILFLLFRGSTVITGNKLVTNVLVENYIESLKVKAD